MIGLSMLMMDAMGAHFDLRYILIHIAILAIEVTTITLIIKSLRKKRKN